MVIVPESKLYWFCLTYMGKKITTCSWFFCTGVGTYIFTSMDMNQPKNLKKIYKITEII